MTTIIKDNLGVPEPYSLSQLRIDNPTVSFGSAFPDHQINPFNVYRVQDIAQPADTATDTFVLGTPVFNSPLWEQNWVATPFTVQEIARNDLLAVGVTRTFISDALYLQHRGLSGPINTIDADIDAIVISSGLTLTVVAALI